MAAVVGAALAQGVQSGASGPDAAARERQIALGQRLYREGIGVSGEPLKAIGAAQALLSGTTVACAACHRRSGYGTSEGQFNIRPITAPALFEEASEVLRSPRIKAQLGTRLRPAYTEALLARAIRNGVDSGGEPLDPVMPRYALADDDMKAIAAYLSTLSATSSPGVDDEDIHFATVIQPGVPEIQRKAMLEIMEAFFKDKAGGGRNLEGRRDAGTMRMYRSYRKWVLHVWQLNGPSETWRSQLEAFYRQQPVFALVGGLGVSSWQPIHDFSEQMEIPSVFPQVNLPVVAGGNEYNFYFSRGVTLDAQVLAKFLRDAGDTGKLVQVYRRNEAGLASAQAMREAMPKGAALEDLVLEGTPDQAFWRKLIAKRPGSVVLWLDREDVTSLAQPDARLELPVYLSFDRLGGKLPAGTDALGTQVRLIYPTDLPPKHAARLLRTKIWLHNKGIPVVDEAVQINTQFAMTVLSDAIGHVMDSFSRDYVAERIEHVVALTPTPSLYPSVSLAPGQRFAAKGSSIVQLVPGDSPQLKPLSGWIVP
jgi:cytochrome c553